MYLKRKYSLLLVLIGVFSLCNCLPESHLQHFSSSMLANNNRIHIESGEEARYGEFGISVSNSFRHDSVAFAEGTYYDFEKKKSDTSKANVFLKFPDQMLTMFGAICGKKLVSGEVVTQIGCIDDKFSYNFSMGIGARLFKWYIAGRAFLIVGITSIEADVFIFKEDVSTDYDLEDSYRTVRPYIGAAFAFNTNHPKLFINPFVNWHVRCYSLFRYEDISVVPLTLSGTVGIYKKFGTLTSAVGLQLSYYLNDQTRILHPQLVAQITYGPIRRK